MKKIIIFVVKSIIMLLGILSLVGFAQVSWRGIKEAFIDYYVTIRNWENKKGERT